MAQRTVEKGISIRVACLAFGISQTCYRYQAKPSAENVEIADHLIRLTHLHRQCKADRLRILLFIHPHGLDDFLARHLFRDVDGQSQL